MTWTYGGNPQASAKDEIRFLIGDKDSKQKWTLSDEEINAMVSLYSANPPVFGHNYAAAAECCGAILVQLKTSLGGKSLGDLSVSANSSTISFFDAAERRLRRLATLQAVVPSFGGLSYAEKRAAQENMDIPKTAATIDGMSIFGPDSGGPSADRSTEP